MYKITPRGIIYRESDGASIPSDNRNKDYRQYLRWVADGNTAQPFFSNADIIKHKSDAIDELANKKILLIAPEPQQRYMLMRGLQITDPEHIKTQEEIAELDRYKSIWVKIHDIMDYRDNLKITLAQAAEPDKFEIEFGWPE